MTTPTIKQMRAWQRQLGSMERKADEIAREMPLCGGARPYTTDALIALKRAQACIATQVVAAKSDARRQGFASMDPERVAELSRLAVAARQRKKTA